MLHNFHIVQNHDKFPIVINFIPLSFILCDVVKLIVDGSINQKSITYILRSDLSRVVRTINVDAYKNLLQTCADNREVIPRDADTFR